MILYLGALENSQSISAPNKSYVPSSGSGIPLKPSKVKVADPRLYPLICALNLLFVPESTYHLMRAPLLPIALVCAAGQHQHPKIPREHQSTRTGAPARNQRHPEPPISNPHDVLALALVLALLQLLQLAEPGCALSAHNQQRSATANSLDISESSALPSRQRVRARNKPLCECQI